MEQTGRSLPAAGRRSRLAARLAASTAAAGMVVAALAGCSALSALSNASAAPVGDDSPLGQAIDDSYVASVGDCWYDTGDDHDFLVACTHAHDSEVTAREDSIPLDDYLNFVDSATQAADADCLAAAAAYAGPDWANTFSQFNNADSKGVYCVIQSDVGNLTTSARSGQ